MIGMLTAPTNPKIAATRDWPALALASARAM
jgi:hypothetical protein